MESGVNKIREAQMIMLTLLDEVDNICKKHNIEYWLDSGTLLGAVRHKGFIPWDDDLDICMMRKDYNRFIDICKTELNPKFFMQTFKTDHYVENQFLKIRDRNSVLKMNAREKGHTGIFIDIFPVDFYSNSGKNYELKKKLNFITQFYWMKYAEIKSPFLKNIKGNIVKVAARGYFAIKSKFDFQEIQRITEKYLKEMDNEEGASDAHLNYGIEVPFNNKMDIDEIFPLVPITFEGKEYFAPNNTEKFLVNLYGDYMKLPKEEDRKPSHCYEMKLKLSTEEYEALNKNYR